MWYLLQRNLVLSGIYRGKWSYFMKYWVGLHTLRVLMSSMETFGNLGFSMWFSCLPWCLHYCQGNKEFINMVSVFQIGDKHLNLSIFFLGTVMFWQWSNCSFPFCCLSSVPRTLNQSKRIKYWLGFNLKILILAADIFAKQRHLCHN
jgi:hypothetical protein